MDVIVVWGLYGLACVVVGVWIGWELRIRRELKVIPHRITTSPGTVPTQDPRLEGRNAFRNGLSRVTCRYPAGTNFWWMWMEGWNDARKETLDAGFTVVYAKEHTHESEVFNTVEAMKRARENYAVGKSVEGPIEDFMGDAEGARKKL